MIKKLRMKLIIASMMSLLAVLLIIEGIAGALNYNRIVAETDQTLEILEENNGKFPDVPPPEKPSEKKKEGRMSSELRYCLTVKGKCSQQIQERLPELILLMR